ncbi:MAG TPA: DUF547 domain-containing protein [Gammaproteobacteria bacterium]
MRLIHRLILKRYGIPPDSVLNRGSSPPLSAGSREIATDLRRIIGTLKVEGFDGAAGRVDYLRLRLSPTYIEYQECADRLRSFDPATLVDDHERLAFWINLYNSLIIDAVIRFEIRRSVHELPGFFWRAAYDIGGKRYASTDIEYGILRANRGHPAIAGAHFGAGDPRLAFSLRWLDPRIHFALVCAARSCPPVAVYDAQHTDRQLDLAARAFINHGGAEVSRAGGTVRLSRIFQWYAPDFGARPLALGDRTPLLSYVSAYLTDQATRDVVSGGRPRVQFMPYDWSLNQ